MPDAVGLLHPGDMGATLGGILRARGERVLWASGGRGPATVARAEAAGLEDAGTIAALAGRCDVILSVCPPHAALDVARAVAGYRGLFVDANAVSPETARSLAAVVEAGGGRFVDGGIVGPPPREPGTTRLYLSGPDVELVVRLFQGTAAEPRYVSERIGDASAVKMAYAAWTKGTTALLLAVRAYARAEGVEEPLLREWSESLPELAPRSLRAARSARRKGWRWVGEMEEIASAFGGAGLPQGFHVAAAEIFRHVPSPDATHTADTVLDRMLTELAREE